MRQANAIVLRIRTDKADEFERLFEAEELPIWDEFSEQGKFLLARLARIEFGTDEAEREDVAVYLLYVEVPGMSEHLEHDEDPRFKAYLEKVLALHAEPPLVFGGDILFERGLRHSRDAEGPTHAAS